MKNMPMIGLACWRGSAKDKRKRELKKWESSSIFDKEGGVQGRVQAAIPLPLGIGFSLLEEEREGTRKAENGGLYRNRNSGQRGHLQRKKKNKLEVYISLTRTEKENNLRKIAEERHRT